VRGDPVEAVQDGRARRTRLFPVRRLHEAVDHEAVLAGIKEFREPGLFDRRSVGKISGAFFEDVVFFDLTALREPPSESRDVFDLPSEFCLRLQQLVARLSICLALAGKLS
jgi:hypothetical protein